MTEIKKADSHAHSEFSFDSQMTYDALCESYISRGFDRIALTDHYDIDVMDAGVFNRPDFIKSKEACEAAREKYGDRLDLVWGIELGQPHLRPERARQVMDEQGFEFVIGSVHSLEMIPDFCMFRYASMPEETIYRLYGRYVDALKEVAAFDGISTLAHVTYPIRYTHRAGREIDLERFYPAYREVFHILIESGVALEVNTSGIRNGYVTSPDTDLLMLYRDCGGERVTVGSDAHFAPDCGADVDTALDMLRGLGFTELTIPGHGHTEQIPL